MVIVEMTENKELKNLLEFGIINIDKPSGPTSFEVSDRVKNILGVRKTSHFGTLDPKVTGVLPIALNRACKLTGFFLGEDKEYIGIMRLHEEVPLERVKEIIKKNFTGIIIQKPPVKSRVKRVEREREIKSFEILEHDGKDFLFRTNVQGGTYIRKLIDDLGKALEIGAHMLELRRVRAGIFEENESITLYDLERAIKGDDLLKKVIIPAEIVSDVYPPVEVEEESVDRILHGQPIYEKNLVKKVKYEKGQIISVFASDRFIGMFKIINEGKVFAKSEFTMQEIK